MFTKTQDSNNAARAAASGADRLAATSDNHGTEAAIDLEEALLDPHAQEFTFVSGATERPDGSDARSATTMSVRAPGSCPGQLSQALPPPQAQKARDFRGLSLAVPLSRCPDARLRPPCRAGARAPPALFFCPSQVLNLVPPFPFLSSLSVEWDAWDNTKKELKRS